MANNAQFKQFRFKQDIGFSEHKVNEAFSLIDKNQDGKLDVQDLKLAFKLIGEEKEDYEIYKMIHTIDSEGKGIDLKDFMQLLSFQMNDKNPEKDVEIAFNAFDTKKQSFIDASQIKALMAEFNEELSLEEAEQVPYILFIFS